MRAAWTIAEIRNIPIRLHLSLLLLPLLIAPVFANSAGAAGIAFGAFVVAGLLTSVALHELGHSIVAQRFGLRVRDITLYPFGGIAGLVDRPRSPRQELWVALAGPAVNVVIVGALLAVSWAFSLPLPSTPTLTPSAASLVAWLIAMNASLAIFNLLPALPMDGGRVLRSLLEMRLGRRRATTIASTIAQVIAVVMGAWAVVSGQLVLAVIAVMVFLGARAEVADDVSRSALEGRTAGQLSKRSLAPLAPGDGLGAAVDRLLTTPERDFAVMLGDRLLGVLTRERILAALAGPTGAVYVAEVMDRDVVQVPSSLSATALRDLLAEKEARVAAVFADHGFVGLVSLDDLAEAALVLSASRFGRERRLGDAQA